MCIRVISELRTGTRTAYCTLAIDTKMVRSGKAELRSQIRLGSRKRSIFITERRRSLCQLRFRVIRGGRSPGGRAAARARRDHLYQDPHVGDRRFDAVGVEQRRPALDAVDDVALVEQQLGEVGAVLPGDAGDQSDFSLFLHGGEKRGQTPFSLILAVASARGLRSVVC